jgi:hypothetical protein
MSSILLCMSSVEARKALWDSVRRKDATWKHSLDQLVSLMLDTEILPELLEELPRIIFYSQVKAYFSHQTLLAKMLKISYRINDY